MNKLKYGNVVLLVLGLGILVVYKLSTDDSTNGPLIQDREIPERVFEVKIDFGTPGELDSGSKSDRVNASTDTGSEKHRDHDSKNAFDFLSASKSVRHSQSETEDEVGDDDDADSSISDIWEERDDLGEDADWRLIEEEYVNWTWTGSRKAFNKWRTGLEDYGVDSRKNFVLSHESVELLRVLPFYLDNIHTYTVSERFLGLLPKKSPYIAKSLGKCAVVGNSGVMKHSGCGKNIDSADFVFRCNIPPLVDYANDVGEKTNLTTVNPSMLYSDAGTISFRSHVYPFNLVLEPYDGVILLACFSHSFFLQTCIKAIQQYYRENAIMTFLNPEHFNYVWDYWKDHGKVNLPSTGFYIASTAVTMCDSVDVYGFWPFSKTGYSGKPQRVKYHYYEEGAARPAHDMIGEFKILYQLHKEGALRLHLGNCSVT